VPIFQSANNLEGRVGNAGQLVDLAQRMYPLNSMATDVRQVFTATGPLQPDSDRFDGAGTLVVLLGHAERKGHGQRKGWWPSLARHPSMALDALLQCRRRVKTDSYATGRVLPPPVSGGMINMEDWDSVDG
jgi:hypothetical protein